LRTILLELQEKGERVWANKRNVQAEMWRHVAEIYFFYREAISNEHTLHMLYVEANLQFKTIKQGMNFGPLLRLVWGDDNCSHRETDRHSRALNAIDAHYRKKPTLFAKDGVAKLAEFIKAQGGITKLAGYVKSENDEPAVDIPDSILAKDPEPTAAAKIAAIFVKAAPEIPNLPIIAPIKSPEITTQIQTGKSDLGILLVRRSGSNYDIVGGSPDPEIIRLVYADVYKRSFAALSPALRCILETLRTQCLPGNLQKFQDALVDVGISGHTKEKKALSHRRLLFIQEGRHLLLSPTNARSGVVTNARLAGKAFIESPDDLML